MSMEANQDGGTEPEQESYSSGRPLEDGGNGRLQEPGVSVRTTEEGQPQQLSRAKRRKLLKEEGQPQQLSKTKRRKLLKEEEKKERIAKSTHISLFVANVFRAAQGLPPCGRDWLRDSESKRMRRRDVSEEFSCCFTALISLISDERASERRLSGLEWVVKARHSGELKHRDVEKAVEQVLYPERFPAQDPRYEKYWLEHNGN
jgi:hypothetical protein